MSIVTATTLGIKVSVETEYEKNYSNPLQRHFVFVYRINIENQSDYTVQLVKRHWYVFDTATGVKEVEGEGVIGLQPIIEPGESHRYISGSNIKSSIGKMNGYYTFEKLIDGRRFKVTIPEFNLIVPFRLN